MNNIVEAFFGSGKRSVRTRPIYQYDYGMILLPVGLELPNAYEVHFGQSESAPTITQIGTADGVSIPDELLTTGPKVHAWIYLHTGDSDGETVYSIVIPVAARGEITDVEPTPAQQDVIDQAIAALNAGVEEVQTIAEAIPQTVEDALTEAKESGEFDGPPGPKGDKGDPGIQGQPGVDGVSPTASVSKSGSIATLTVTDATGTTTVTISDGQQGPKGETGSQGERGEKGDKGDTGSAGADGISPSASVSKTGDTATVTITDRTGTTSVTLKDGADGEDGTDGFSPSASVSKSGSVSTFTVTDKNGTTSIAINDGTDGVSPSASVSKSGGTSTLTVTDRTGTTSVTINDGEKGEKGDTGEPGTTDYNDLDNKPTIPSKISDLTDDTEVTVTGSVPSITAVAGKRYVCAAAVVTELVFVPSQTGLCEVIFTSGTTPTVLTIPVTVKMPPWWTGVQANTIYDIMVLDGVYGAVMTWAS